MRRGLTLLGFLALLAAGGCASIARPDYGHPGPAELQQQRAAVYDPFPDNDGAPTVEGGRPPAYDAPPPDFIRSRNYQEGFWARPR